MNTAIIEEFKSFSASISPLLNINDEVSYNAALLFMDDLFEASEDVEGDPVSPLIDMLAASINRYESKDQELMAFIDEADETPKDIALIRVLMDQYQLDTSGLPEIGDKTVVSRVLSGKRSLTKAAIEKLCHRFNLRPDMLFIL
jgi:HTH-type transcriptional regulator/antitoxin HigA